MAPRKPRNESLRRRIARLEALLTLAFDRDGRLDPELRYLLTHYLRDIGKDGDYYPYSEFDFALGRLADRQFFKLEGAPDQIAELRQRQRELEDRLQGVSKELTERINNVDYRAAALNETQKSLSAETHGWLALQALAVPSAEIRTARFVPLRVYLSETPPGAIKNVTEAVSQLLTAFGFGFADEFPAVQGSWWKKWLARGNEAMSQPEVAERLAQIERALQLKGLGQPQAEIDAKQAGAVAQLMAGLDKIPNAALQVGSILLIKLTSAQGAAIHVRTLTQQELIHLENNQKLLASPTDLLERLSELCQSKAASETLTTEIAEIPKNSQAVGKSNGEEQPPKKDGTNTSGPLRWPPAADGHDMKSPNRALPPPEKT